MEALYSVRKDRTTVKIPKWKLQRDEFGMESLDDYFGEGCEEKWTKISIHELSKMKDTRYLLESRDLKARGESSVAHNTQAHSSPSEIVQSPRNEGTISESSSQIPSDKVHDERGADESFGIDEFNDIDAPEGFGDFNEEGSGNDEGSGSNGSSEVNGKHETYGNVVIDEIEDSHSSESGGAHVMQIYEDLEHQDLSGGSDLIEVPEVLITSDFLKSPEKRHSQKSVSLEVIQEGVHHKPPVNPRYDSSISYLDTSLDIPESSHEDRQDEDYNTSYIPSSPMMLEDLRRSTRVRVPPLAFWRNERIVYKKVVEVGPDVPKALARALELIPLKTIQRVINIPEKPIIIRKRPQKQAQRRTPRKRSRNQGEILNQEPAPEIDVPGIVGSEIEGPGAGFSDIDIPQIDHLETGGAQTDKFSIGKDPVGNSPTGKSPTESPQIEMPLMDETPLDNPKIGSPTLDEPSTDEPSIDRSYFQDSQVDDSQVDDSQIDDPQIDDPQIDDPQIDDPEWFRNKSLTSKVFKKGGATNKRIVSWAPEGADFQHPSKDAGNYRLAPLFNTDPNLASGLLELPIGGFKNLRASNKFNFVFHVTKGLVEVTFNSTKIVMEEGCSFQVPKFNEYSLKNSGRETASLFFCWSQPPTG